MKLLDSLNDQQQRAVTTNATHVSIVAGPGTGKTKTLTARIAYLLQKGVSPGSIAALTFTNKAAREIKTRVQELAGGMADKVRITTFHGLCYELLQREQSGKSLNIITEAERLALAQDLKKAASLKDVTAREMLAKISWAKSLPKPPDPAIAKFVDTYNKALHERGMVDFDDLLLQAYTQLQTSPTHTIQHVLVDEFQDTNDLQYKILQQLAAESVFVIGDPLQSIYGFRGASGEAFAQFTRDFPRAEHITLTINYRSTPAIVRLSNAVFPESPALQAYGNQPGVAQAIEVLNEYSEADWVIGTIESAIGGTDFLRSHDTQQHHSRQCTFRDFAVLYRTHRVAATIERAFAESGIPYQKAGEGSPYEKPYIKAVIALMRWSHNPSNETPIKLQTLPTLQNFKTTQLGHMLAPLQNAKLAPSKLAHKIIDTFNIGSDKPIQSRDLNQFIGSLVRFDERGLGAYLQHLDEIAEQDFYDADANVVTLLTIHAAKGLEFDHVFLLACEDNLLPYRRQHTEQNIDEEKRLFYVAVTRAQTYVDILHARSRNAKPATISPFIMDLAGDVLPRHTDPNLADHIRRSTKRRHKRSQTSLF